MRTHPMTSLPIRMVTANNNALDVLNHNRYKLLMIQLTSGAHSVFNIKLHVVFVVAYRRKAITPRILTELESIFREICCENAVDLIEFSGESDHVHLLISIRPNITISSLIRSLKSISSLKIRQRYWNSIKQKLWGQRFWTRSYCAISVGDGATTEIIKRYIQNQTKPSSARRAIHPHARA